MEWSGGERREGREVSTGRGAAGSADQHPPTHTVPRRQRHRQRWHSDRLPQPASRLSCPAGARDAQRTSPRSPPSPAPRRLPAARPPRGGSQGGEGQRVWRGGAARRDSRIAASRPEPWPVPALWLRRGAPSRGGRRLLQRTSRPDGEGSAAAGPTLRPGRSPSSDGYRRRAPGSWPGLKQGLSRASNRVCIGKATILG